MENLKFYEDIPRNIRNRYTKHQMRTKRWRMDGISDDFALIYHSGEDWKLTKNGKQKVIYLMQFNFEDDDRLCMNSIIAIFGEHFRKALNEFDDDDRDFFLSHKILMIEKMNKKILRIILDKWKDL